MEVTEDTVWPMPLEEKYVTYVSQGKGSLTRQGTWRSTRFDPEVEGSGGQLKPELLLGFLGKGKTEQERHLRIS